MTRGERLPRPSHPSTAIPAVSVSVSVIFNLMYEFYYLICRCNKASLFIYIKSEVMVFGNWVYLQSVSECARSTGFLFRTERVLTPRTERL